MSSIEEKVSSLSIEKRKEYPIPRKYLVDKYQ